MRKLLALLNFGLVITIATDHALAQTTNKASFFPSNTLLPPHSMYVSPAQSSAQYANGGYISNVTHHAFTESLPPPTLGNSATHTFNAQVDFDVFLGGNPSHVSAPAIVTLSIQAVGTVAGQQLYNTEMLQLDISGGTLPAGVQIRASPSRPSIGQTTMGQVNGGYMISSFFDIFTELSLDGGKSWSPSIGAQAGHVDLLGPDPTFVSPSPEFGSLLPPPGGEYVTPPQFQLTYPGNVVIQGVRNHLFTQSLDPLTIPPGSTVTQQFGAIVDFQFSMNGGQSNGPMRAPATVTVKLRNASPGPPAIFETEMTQLDIAGGDLPANLMLRESPTLPSYGGTAVRKMGDSTFQISSFFDIFTELSLDGGRTWNAATSPPAHVELQRVALIHSFTSPNLPPANGLYSFPDLIQYPGGIVISNLVNRNLSPSQPPPPPGQSQFQTLSSTVDMMISLDNGRTFSPASAPASGSMVVSNHPYAGSTAQYYDTEMLQLDISGGSLSQNIKIRESPTKASVGRTSEWQDPSAGIFRVSSFFDVFTEMSLDNGQSWNAAITQPGVTGLHPNPIDHAWVLNCPSNITVFASSDSGAIVNFPLTLVIFPDCPFGPFTISCNWPSGSMFPVGTTTVTCMGTDGCGEHPTCSFTVTVLPLFHWSGVFTHILGNATLSIYHPTGTGAPSSSFLIVSNLGPSGQDGFHLDVGAVDSALLNFQPFPTTYNTCIVSTATGPYAADANHVLGIFTYLGGTNPIVRADYSSIGASLLNLRVTDESNHLVSSSVINNAAWLNINNLFPPPCTNTTTTVYTYWQGPDFSWVRFCKYGCNCFGTNCYSERIVCLSPIVSPALRPLVLSALDILSQGSTVPSSLTIESEAIGRFGVMHEAKGEATFDSHPAVLVLNDLGSSGEDGAAADLNDVGQFDIALAPTRVMGPGDCFKITAFGKLNAGPNVDLGMATVSDRPGGGCDVSVDFSKIGASRVRLDFLLGSQFTGSTTLSSGPLGTMYGNGNLVGCGELPPPLPGFWLGFDSTFSFLAADGKSFTGDHIRVLAANPSGQLQSLSRFCVQGCNIGQLAVLGESVRPAITSISRPAGGGFQITGQGVIGVLYTLESTPSLNGRIQWTPVTSAMSDLNGTFQLFDFGPGKPQLFYHVVTQ